MEEEFHKLVEEYNNRSLIDIKNEIRKKLYKKFDNCRYSKKLEQEEIKFFKSVLAAIDDKEFDELFKKYDFLIFLLSFNNKRL